MADIQLTRAVRARHLTATTMLATLAATAHAQTMTSAEFLDEYVPAAKKLEQAYGSMTMSVHVHHPDRGDYTIEHLSIDGKWHTRAVYEDRETVRIGGDDGAAQGGTSMLAHTRPKSEQHISTFAFHPFLAAMFSYRNAPIYRELADDWWRFRSAEVGKDIVRVTFDVRNSNTKEWQNSMATVDFWRSAGWPILLLELGDEQTSAITEIDYSDSLMNGVPVPEGVVQQRRTNGADWLEYVATFNSVTETQHVNPKAFTLDGVELTADELHALGWQPIALSLAVVVLVLIAIWLGFRNRGLRPAMLVVLFGAASAVAYAFDPLDHEIINDPPVTNFMEQGCACTADKLVCISDATGGCDQSVFGKECNVANSACTCVTTNRGCRCRY